MRRNLSYCLMSEWSQWRMWYLFTELENTSKNKFRKEKGECRVDVVIGNRRQIAVGWGVSEGWVEKEIQVVLWRKLTIAKEGGAIAEGNVRKVSPHVYMMMWRGKDSAGVNGSHQRSKSPEKEEIEEYRWNSDHRQPSTGKGTPPFTRTEKSLGVGRMLHS